MSAAKRPASCSPLPGPETKKHHLDDTGTETEADYDPMPADHQGGIGTSGLVDDMPISQPTIDSPLLSPSEAPRNNISDGTTTIAGPADGAISDKPEGQGTNDEDELTGRCSRHLIPSGRSKFILLMTLSV